MSIERNCEDLFLLHPASEWVEADGTVLWWHLPISEPPYVGEHECMGEEREDGTTTSCVFLQRGGWLKHWSRIPRVIDPVCHCGIELSQHTVYDGHSFTEMEALPDTQPGRVRDAWDAYSDDIRAGIGNERGVLPAVALLEFDKLKKVVEKETSDYDGPNVPGWEGGFAENH